MATKPVAYINDTGPNREEDSYMIRVPIHSMDVGARKSLLRDVDTDRAESMKLEHTGRGAGGK